MNALEVLYWVDKLAVPTFLVGAALFTVGVWGCRRRTPDSPTADVITTGEVSS